MTTETLTLERAIREIPNDRIFSVTFRKKDGTLRDMVARIHSEPFSRYDPLSKGLLPVKDMQAAAKGETAYRFINLATITKLNGIEVTQDETT